MPTQITSAGITFNDATSLTSATLAANSVGATQIVNGSVTASKLGTTEQKQIAKAWVNFNGTGTIGTNQTIRSSYNVSSVTKNGTGDYTVNFATAMADANYAYSISGSQVGVDVSNINPHTLATGTFRFQTFNFDAPPALRDYDFASVAIFGN
jgi:hypothetical protein